MSDERMIKNGNKTGENGKENCSEHVRRKKISLVLRPSMGQIYFTISFQNASVIRTRQILFSSFYTRQNRASEVKHLTWVSWSENGREHIWLAVQVHDPSTTPVGTTPYHKGPFWVTSSLSQGEDRSLWISNPLLSPLILNTTTMSRKIGEEGKICVWWIGY